jgi:hypothetical protein
MVMIVVMVAMLVIAMLMLAAVAVTIVMAAFVLFMAPVSGLIFGRSHEIHRAVAGLVLVTIPVPVPGVLRWYVQIHRLWRSFNTLHDHRLLVNQRRALLTHYDPAVDTGPHFTGNGGIDVDLRFGAGREYAESQHGNNRGIHRSHKTLLG